MRGFLLFLSIGLFAAGPVLAAPGPESAREAAEQVRAYYVEILEKVNERRSIVVNLPDTRKDIVSVNEAEVASVDDLHRFLAEWPIGEPVTLAILRGRERMTTAVVPGEAAE